MAAFTARVMEARADKEQEIQLYLEYRRDCEKSEIAQEMGQDVAISLPAAVFFVYSESMKRKLI